MNIQLAKSVSLTETIDAYLKRPKEYEQKEYKYFEVTAGDGIYRILAKDELDAYKVYLEEYSDGALEL